MIEIDAAGLDQRASYKLVTGIMVPRPIAFVSTISPEGVPNIAPFSWCNVLSYQPALVSFTVARRPQATDGRKDTLRNLETSGDFVLNVVTYETQQRMVDTSAYWAPEDDEFALCGLTALPSDLVRSPRLAESPVSLECQLERVVRAAEGPDQVVVGRVVRIHLSDTLGADATAALRRVIRPGRLGGINYTRVEEPIPLTHDR